MRSAKMVAAHLRDLSQGSFALSAARGGTGWCCSQHALGATQALDAKGVVGTRLYEKHPPRYEYFLTEKGKSLGPVLRALHNWGEQFG
jgi:DNA-binding HxlR family transcriptional regulator